MLPVPGLGPQQGRQRQVQAQPQEPRRGPLEPMADQIQLLRLLPPLALQEPQVPPMVPLLR